MRIFLISIRIAFLYYTCIFFHVTAQSCDNCTDRPCELISDPESGNTTFCSLPPNEHNLCLTRCNGRNCVKSLDNGYTCEGDPTVCTKCTQSCMLMMNYTLGRYVRCEIPTEHKRNCKQKCGTRDCIIEMEENDKYTYRCEVCSGICTARGRCLLKNGDKCVKSLCRIPRNYVFTCYMCKRGEQHCVVTVKDGKNLFRCATAQDNLPGRFCEKGRCVFGVCRDCVCHCRRGYGGESCNQKCDMKCENGGSCVFDDGRMFCACRSGFYGAKCDSQCEVCREKICRVVVDERNVTTRCKVDAVDRKGCFKACLGEDCGMIKTDTIFNTIYYCVKQHSDQKFDDCVPCRKQPCIFVQRFETTRMCFDVHNETINCGSDCSKCLKTIDADGNFTFSCISAPICGVSSTCFPGKQCLIRHNTNTCSYSQCENMTVDHKLACEFLCMNQHCVVTEERGLTDYSCVSETETESYCRTDCVHGRCENCRCKCNGGYIGRTCNRTCKPRVCRNRGTCAIGKDGNTICHCRSGFRGNECEKECPAELTCAWGKTLAECKAFCVPGNGDCRCGKPQGECCPNPGLGPCHCECSIKFRGVNCSVPCDCGNGRCFDNTDKCSCYDIKGEGRWTGEKCDVFISTASFPTGAIVGTAIGALAAVIILVTIATYILWRKRNVWVLQLIHRFRFYEDDDGKQFDAFISYSGGVDGSFDHWFVYNVLRPTLEDRLPFKLCIHHRDFSPGELIVDNIMWGIEESRRTIMIISSNYVQSAWCAEEYQKAQSEMLQLRHKVIPIFLEEPASVEIRDRTLEHILSSVTYIAWPGFDDDEKLKKFFGKLVYSLPKKKVDIFLDCLIDPLHDMGKRFTQNGHSISKVDSLDSSGYDTLESENRYTSLSGDKSALCSPTKSLDTVVVNEGFDGPFTGDYSGNYVNLKDGIKVDKNLNLARSNDTALSMELFLDNKSSNETMRNEPLASVNAATVSVSSADTSVEMMKNEKENEKMANNGESGFKQYPRENSTDYNVECYPIISKSDSPGDKNVRRVDDVTIDDIHDQDPDDLDSVTFTNECDQDISENTEDSITLEKKRANEMFNKTAMEVHRNEFDEYSLDSITLEKQLAKNCKNDEDKEDINSVSSQETIVNKEENNCDTMGRYDEKNCEETQSEDSVTLEKKLAQKEYDVENYLDSVMLEKKLALSLYNQKYNDGFVGTEDSVSTSTQQKDAENYMEDSQNITESYDITSKPQNDRNNSMESPQNRTESYDITNKPRNNINNSMEDSQNRMESYDITSKPQNDIKNSMENHQPNKHSDVSMASMNQNNNDTFEFKENLELNLTATIRSNAPIADDMLSEDSGKRNGREIETEKGREDGDGDYGNLTLQLGTAYLGMGTSQTISTHF